MSASPKHPSYTNRHPAYKEDEAPQLQRPCDYCGQTIALLYCRADSAKLCFSCDREVHSTNQLFSKHTRTLLCDSCDDSPATILCSTENSVLCQNCDWERHNLSLSSVHERRSIEGFTGFPSVSELLTIVGIEDIGKKSLLSAEESEGCGVTGDGFLAYDFEGISDLFVWDAPAFVSLDDLISSSGSSHNYQAMEVPPLPKNRKGSCGRHRGEILSQLRELAKSEPELIHGDVATDNVDTVNFLFPEEYLQPGNLSTGFKRGIEADKFPLEKHTQNSESINQVVPPDMSLRDYTEENPVIHSISAVSENHTYGNNGRKPSYSLKLETLSSTAKAAPCELTSQERDSALLRYQQKKKTRRYDKHIRYESRKVRAQSRVRVKGRFAKMEH